MTEKYSEVSRLFDACRQDYEYAALEELCFKAGLLWRCNARTEEFDGCGYNNHEDDNVCAECGAPRLLGETA